MAIPAAIAGGCLGEFPASQYDALEPTGRLRVPPLVWCTAEPDGSREVRNFLGLLYHQVAERAPEGGPAGPEDVVRRSSLDILWPVYHTGSILRADGRRVATRRFLPFVWMRRESEKSGAGADYTQLRLNVLGIVLSLKSDNYGRGMKEADFLWPLGHYFFGERQLRGRPREIAQTLRFLPFLRLERTWRMKGERTHLALPGATGRREMELSRDREPDQVRLRVLQPLFGYERDDAPRTTRAFLLGGTYAGEAGRRRPWGLVFWERGPSTDSEFGLLWQLLFVVRRWGSADLAALDADRATVPRPRGARLGQAGGPGGRVAGRTRRRPSDLWRATKWLFHGSPGRLVKFAPFIYYESDWEADSKSFSILLGLCAYEREGSRRCGRFLWVFRWGRR